MLAATLAIIEINLFKLGAIFGAFLLVILLIPPLVQSLRPGSKQGRQRRINAAFRDLANRFDGDFQAPSFFGKFEPSLQMEYRGRKVELTTTITKRSYRGSLGHTVEHQFYTAATIELKDPMWGQPVVIGSIHHPSPSNQGGVPRWMTAIEDRVLGGYAPDKEDNPHRHAPAGADASSLKADFDANLRVRGLRRADDTMARLLANPRSQRQLLRMSRQALNFSVHEGQFTLEVEGEFDRAEALRRWIDMLIDEADALDDLADSSRQSARQSMLDDDGELFPALQF